MLTRLGHIDYPRYYFPIPVGFRVFPVIEATNTSKPMRGPFDCELV